MHPDRTYGEESPVVQAHLGIMQSVIQRMAANSAASKGWCIALVSAILVIVADKGRPAFALIAAIPTILFLFLDGYYLALERTFRDSYNAFIRKLHEGGVSAIDLYAVTPVRPSGNQFCRSLGSFSIWPFYAALGLMILVTMQLIIPAGTPAPTP